MISDNAKTQYSEALNCYWGLEGHVVNDVRAVTAFEQAAEGGHPAALLQMGVFYKCGNLHRTDHTRSKEYFSSAASKESWFRERAEAGNPLAMWQLSRALAYGLFTESTDTTDALTSAVGWCRKAAIEGHALAQFDLSQCYHRGEGVAYDPHEATKWCRLAAEQGMVEAASWMGYYYRDGTGIAQSHEQAVLWLRRASSLGHHTAQRFLGVLYLKKNMRSARKWVKNSIDNGSQSAKHLLNTLPIRHVQVPVQSASNSRASSPLDTSFSGTSPPTIALQSVGVAAS